MNSDLRITIWIQQREVKGRFLARNNFAYELPGNGAETQAHHRVAGCDGEVGELRRAAEVRQTIGRTRTQPTPRLHTCEVLWREFGKVFRHGLDDPLNAHGIDIFIQTRDFHRAAEAQRVSHRCNGHTRLGENGAELWQVAWASQRQAVTLSRLHRDFKAELLRHRG